MARSLSTVMISGGHHLNNDSTYELNDTNNEHITINGTVGLEPKIEERQSSDNCLEESLVGSDQLMNDHNENSGGGEMMNLLLSQQKQQAERRNDSSSYGDENRLIKDELANDQGHGTTSENESRNASQFSSEHEAYYASFASSDLSTHLSSTSGYEVTTFVTEDGQTGQIIISSNGGYSTELNGVNGIVSLGDSNITTIMSPDGQILSLGENTIEQIPGLENFGGSIQLATTHNPDGTTQLQYILKQVHNGSKNKNLINSTQVMKKVYQCSNKNCKKQFTTPYRLKAHARAHSGETFDCQENGCGKTFLTTGDLHKHTKTHFGAKDFICDVEYCKKEYTTAHHLKVHRRQHSGERPFTCEWEGCDKRFTTGYGLKSHFRTHTNERPYKCQEEDCPKSFKTSGDLQKHVRTHTGERPFVCPHKDCNRSFTTSNIRKVHLRTHTGEKPYKCEIEGCGRMFASATNYKNHCRIHTGERPYHCEVPGCCKRFTEYSSLYKHNIVHTQQKPYTCTLCHKTYRQTSTLAMHKRTVHGTSEVTEIERRMGEIAQSAQLPRKMLKVRSQNNVDAPSYLQGMSLVINHANGMESSQQINLSTRSDSNNIPGAIAIPIQVTVNADGTIAGAQGLNLTDGRGRMIPVNLSVSIPMATLGQMGEDNSSQVVPNNNIYTTDEGASMNVLSDSSDRLSPVSPSSSSLSDENDVTPRVFAKHSLSDHINASQIINLQRTRDLMQTEIPEDQYEIDCYDADVTEKYLTSHYSKDLKES
ncbi:zinc finger protein 143 isoform X1 [Hydra vulgaris]|uniref:zinc finger protein 143 isoform X1 n=1 Tax=Hydra vulgaris TaxID=6087 RepID=UPI001F5E83E8|nr:zinc finger protein 143 [Hydra vulgaris]XP_012561738.2 zinc finger protein 143 [Hydra vulgaris]